MCSQLPPSIYPLPLWSFSSGITQWGVYPHQFLRILVTRIYTDTPGATTITHPSARFATLPQPSHRGTQALANRATCNATTLQPTCL
jgi:hypothetical protein